MGREIVGEEYERGPCGLQVKVAEMECWKRQRKGNSE